MGQHAEIHEIQPKAYVVSQRAKTVYSALIFLGALVMAMAFYQNAERAWTSYLTALMFFTAPVVGAIFFLAVNHLTNTGWNVNIRRFNEAFVSFTPVIFVASMALYFGLKHLYPWADPEVMAHDPLLKVKSSYLNVPFFLVRMVIFGGGLWFFGRKFVSQSLQQDQTGDESLTRKQVPFAIAYMFFFALSFSFFAVDTIMALLPHWYSTIFGIYAFAGGMQAFLAMLILLIQYVLKKDLVKGAVSVEHVHDLAKYLKGFTVFWAYIAFSQYLLIWYTNIPEETEFYYIRSHGAWVAVSLSLLFLRFAVPFFALLPRAAKRSETHLSLVCVLILVMHYVDIFWLVYPNFNEHAFVFSVWEMGAMMLFGGLFLMGVHKFLSQNSLLPVKDPRRMESYSHHVTY